MIKVAYCQKTTRIPDKN